MTYVKSEHSLVARPTTPSWVEFASGVEPQRTDIHEWIFQHAVQALTSKCLKAGTKPPSRIGCSGEVKHENVYNELVSMLERVGARLIDENVYAWDDDFEHTFVWDSGSAFIGVSEESSALGINFVSTDEVFVGEVRNFLRENLVKRASENRGRVFILAAGPGGVSATPLGYAAVPLEVDNYDPSVQEGIKNTVTELNNPFPSGRLSIFEGPPGGGKTFLIRSLINEVPAGNFIFVPPELVPALGGPGMVSALLNLKSESNTFAPIILICEDADSILTKRGADNMPAISALLNLTSGILGDVVDCRVLCTTNAHRSEMESALVRSGRLSSFIHLPPLSRDHADRILQRLTSNPEPFNWSGAEVPRSQTRKGGGSIGFSSGDTEILKDKVLLADVFKVARSRGWDVSASMSLPKTKRVKIVRKDVRRGH